MKVVDNRPPKAPELPKEKIIFTLTFRREYDSDFLEEFKGSTTEELAAYLQTYLTENEMSPESLVSCWEMLEDDPPSDLNLPGFEMDVEFIVPGQKRLV